jgi:hypothetical protein
MRYPVQVSRWVKKICVTSQMTCTGRIAANPKMSKRYLLAKLPDVTFVTRLVTPQHMKRDFVPSGLCYFCGGTVLSEACS